MASTGFAADFARKSVGYKIAVFAIAAAVLFGLYYQFVFSKLRRDQKAAEDHRAELVTSEQKLKKDESEADDVEAKLQALKSTIKDNDDALPTAAQLPAFFDMLNRKVGEAGVDVGKWEYQSQVPVSETIDKVPVQIEIHGTFYQLEKFFYLLYKVSQKEGDEGPAPINGTAPPPAAEERNRILTVEDLHIGEPAVKNNQLILTADFRASTFRKEEAPPPAATPAKPGDKKGAGAGSGSGSGSSTAPAGLLGAPQRAKEKVDDAMQKDDDRAHSGPGGDGTTPGADRVKGGM